MEEKSCCIFNRPEIREMQQRFVLLSPRKKNDLDIAMKIVKQRSLARPAPKTSFRLRESSLSE